MKLFVCIKQVPGTTKVDMDEEKGVLKRSLVEAKMNPYDLVAIEAALRLKEEKGGSVTAISMGPPQAEEVIKEAFMMGVDFGVLISDMAFAGSDVLATSLTLSEGIKLLGDFDIIFCGKQTTDGDTAQVGPEVSEILDIPHVSNVIEILEVNEKSIKVKIDTSDMILIQEVSFPCLIALDKDIYTPRLPSYKIKRNMKDKKPQYMTLSDFSNKNIINFGLKGSPTQVERIFKPEDKLEKVIVNLSSEENAEFIFNKLKQLKVI